MRSIPILFLFLILPLSISAQEKAPRAYPWGDCLRADIWVVVDYSRSINGYEKDVGNALKEINAGILKNPSTRRLGIISFNEFDKLVQDLSSNYGEVYKQIVGFEKTKAHGYTNIDQGLYAASTQQKNSEPNPEADAGDFKKILILISDGENTVGDIDDLLRTSRQMKEDGWWIYSVMTDQTGFSQDNPASVNIMERYYNLLRDISGSPLNREIHYVDFITLDALPKYFREHFICM